MRNRSRLHGLFAAFIFVWMNFGQTADLALPDSPLNLISPVEPNVMLIIDDSGSMDWEVLISGAFEGVGSGALSGYYVLPSDNNGLDLASAPNHYFTISDEDHMAAQGASGLGVWRLKNHVFNSVYYDPNKTYQPWPGQDAAGNAWYANADPQHAWIDPNNPNAGLFDLTSLISFTNYSHHLNAAYTETVFPATHYKWLDLDADGVVDASDGKTKVEIKPTITSYLTSADRTDCVAAPLCTYTEEIQNFANWYSYHRKRSYVARAAMGEVINSAHGLKLGLYQYNDGIQQIPLSLGFGSHRSTLLGNVYNATFECTSSSCFGTPARHALASVGEYFAQINSPIATSHGRCQQNFNIMLTDGYRNGALSNVQSSVISNEDGDANTAFDGGVYADVYAQTLADVAMYLYENDLQPSIQNDVPVISAEDSATHQHMNTYALAFGVSGLLDPFDTLTPGDPSDTNPHDPLFAWPQPVPSTASTIDDLWHATYNGRGVFLNAMQADGVLNAFKQMISSVQDRVASSSGVTLNSAALGVDTQLFQARFDSADWHGELLAYPINTDGSLGDVLWDAGCRLTGGYCAATDSVETGQHWNSGRVILTNTPPDNSGYPGKGVAFRWPVNPAAPSVREITLDQILALRINPADGSVGDEITGMDRLNYIRGASITGMRERNSLLGDIVHASPVYVGAPPFAYPDSLEAGSYASFAQAQANRTPIIYVGANDGMLHGFNAKSTSTDAGREVLAYIPSEVYADLPTLSHPDYGGLPGHRYFVNGSPGVGDVYIGGAWRTLLVGSLGKGGQGIYALDVTRPGDFSESNAAAIVQWEFTDATDNDLGYTYGQPAIVRLANGKWAVVVGNGYNHTEADDNPGSSGNAVVYLLDAADGSLLGKFDTLQGKAQDPQGQNRPNGIATVSPVDVNGDHIIDYLYAPDLFGNVWKLDVRSNNASRWGFAHGSSASPQPFFTAKSLTHQAQAITSAVDVSLHPVRTGQLVYFGTGKYLEPGDANQASYDTQTFYAIWDRNQASQTDINRTHLLQQSIIEQANYAPGQAVRITSNNPISWYMGSGAPSSAVTQGYLGWYIDLYNTQSGNTANRGERVVADPVLRSDRIVFTTMQPSADACDLGGASWLMELDAASGGRLNLPAFDLNGDGVFTSADNIALSGGGNAVVSGLKSNIGILATPAILQNNNGYAGEGSSNRAGELKYLSGSSGNIQMVRESQPISRVGRQSWRQIFEE